MVFTTRLSGGKDGRNGFEHELRRLGVTQKNGKPNHPQTQGKVERFQCATMRAVVSPVQPGELGGRFLGLMAYPAPKGWWGQEHAS